MPVGGRRQGRHMLQANVHSGNPGQASVCKGHLPRRPSQHKPQAMACLPSTAQAHENAPNAAAPTCVAKMVLMEEKRRCQARYLA